MIKTYNNFIDKKGKLYIEKDLDDTEKEEAEDWKYTIDISDIFSKYSNNVIDIIKFNELFVDILNNNKNNIIQIFGEDVWLNIQKILLKLKQKNNEIDINKIFNNLYNLFDKYFILLKNEI